MEYYMGRSLTNAMVNLGMDSEMEEALYEVSESVLGNHTNTYLTVSYVCILQYARFNLFYFSKNDIHASILTMFINFFTEAYYQECIKEESVEQPIVLHKHCA